MNSAIRNTALLLFVALLNFNMAMPDLVSASSSWSRTFGGTAFDWANDVVECSDGGLIFTGNTFSFGLGLRDVWVVRTDQFGNLLWDVTFGGTWSDEGRAVIEVSTGGFAVTGFVKGLDNTNCQGWLIRIDSEGNLLWNSTYGGEFLDEFYSIKEVSSGGFILIGESNSYSLDNYDAWLIRTNVSGTLVWNRTYGGTHGDYGRAVVEASDGGFLLVGITESFGAGDYDIWLLRTDLNGNPEWNCTFGGPLDDWVLDLIETTDGDFLVAGATDSFAVGNRDGWLLCVDRDGSLIWNHTYGWLGEEMLNSVIECGTRGFALTGYTASYGAGSNDLWVIRTDEVGNLLWEGPFGGPNLEVGCSIIESSNGGFITAGYTESFGSGELDAWILWIPDSPPLPTLFDALPIVALILGLSTALVGVALFIRWRRHRTS